MTFVQVWASANSLWVCADRQLSVGNSPSRNASGVKIACIEAKGSVAVVAYAGVGSVYKRQVSDWIGRLLNGVGGSLDQSMQHLAEVAHQKLRPYARQAKTTHYFIAAAIRDGVHSIYTIDPLREPWLMVINTAKTRREIGRRVAGCGARFVTGPHMGIDRLIRRYDSGEVSGARVASKLACVNRDVSRKASPWVSPECIVYWRIAYRHEVRAYDAAGRIVRAPRIPHVADGFPLTEFFEATRGFTGTGFDMNGSTANADASDAVSRVLSRGPDNEFQ